MAKFGEGIKNFGAGSSNLANTSTQFPYAGIKRTPVQCKGNLDMPHRSFHKPGTVNAQARIKCQIPMKELKGEVKLSRVGIVTISSGIKTVHNRKNWTANAAMACDRVKREYRSSVHVTWKSPENVEPPTGEISFQKEASVEC